MLNPWFVGNLVSCLNPSSASADGKPPPPPPLPPDPPPASPPPGFISLTHFPPLSSSSPPLFSPTSPEIDPQIFNVVLGLKAHHRSTPITVKRKQTRNVAESQSTVQIPNSQNTVQIPNSTIQPNIQAGSVPHPSQNSTQPILPTLNPNPFQATKNFTVYHPKKYYT